MQLVTIVVNGGATGELRPTGLPPHMAKHHGMTSRIHRLTSPLATDLMYVDQGTYARGSTRTSVREPITPGPMPIGTQKTRMPGGQTSGEQVGITKLTEAPLTLLGQKPRQSTGLTLAAKVPCLRKRSFGACKVS